MENFTDIFGEDLANLEDLGNLGNFPPGSGEMDARQVKAQSYLYTVKVPKLEHPKNITVIAYT